MWVTVTEIDETCFYLPRGLLVCPMLCNSWTEYKFTCVCVYVSVTLSVNSPTGQTPRPIFAVDSLNDADLRKDVPYGGLDDE